MTNKCCEKCDHVMFKGFKSSYHVCDNSSCECHSTTKQGWEEDYDLIVPHAQHFTDADAVAAHVMNETIEMVWPTLREAIKPNIRLLIASEITKAQHCQQDVEGGTAICGCKLGCHLHGIKSHDV